jgi:hypothetical protein
LTKSRLEEFRSLLNSLDPDLVFLSETFWNNKFNVKFKNCSILKKDRNTRHGGGVAMLFLKTLKMDPIPMPYADTLEVIGAQLSSETGPIDCFSVYCPRGDCPPEDIVTC